VAALSPADRATLRRAAGLIAERGGATVSDLLGGPWWDPKRRGAGVSIVAAPAPQQSAPKLSALPKRAARPMAELPRQQPGGRAAKSAKAGDENWEQF